jgi:hypothetical protein
MSRDIIPTIELSMKVNNAATDEEALEPALKLIHSYLDPNFDPRVRGTIRQASTDQINGDHRRSRMMNAVRTMFSNDPDPKTRDFKRLLLGISITDASPDPEEVFKNFEAERAAASVSGVDVEELVSIFALISSEGVAHFMLNRDFRLDLFEWYVEKDETIDIHALKKAIIEHRGMPNNEPVATDEELQTLKNAVINGVRETARDAAWLLAEVYAHRNTRSKQRKFIREIGENPFSYSVTSWMYSGPFRVYEDEPDTPTRTYKRQLLALSIENYKIDYRDSITSFAGYHQHAVETGVDTKAVAQEIAAISTKQIADLIFTNRYKD